MLSAISSLTAISAVSALSAFSPFSTFSALFTFLFSFFPTFFSEIVGFNLKGSVVAGVLELFGGRSFSKGNFEDGQKAFLSDGEESLFFWFPHINNLALSDVDDLVKTLHLASDHFCDPKGAVHETLGCLDCNERFAFTKEESEGSGHILA